MNFYDINLINGGHISIKEFDKKAISPFHKEAFLHVYSNVNKQATVILERSEMIALSLILQERIMHYPSYSFTAAMFEKQSSILKRKIKLLWISGCFGIKIIWHSHIAKWKERDYCLLLIRTIMLPHFPLPENYLSEKIILMKWNLNS